MTRIKTFDRHAVQWFVGLTMVVFGVVGLLTYFLPYASTAQVRLGFSAASAGVLVGACLALYRKPTTFVVAVYVGLVLALWQFKYGALPF